MSSIILHHYAGSPFSEKIRAILGFKKLAWQSVQVPVMMPKPDLLPLTGGYRKAPVMQIGRDIYCDTRLIAQIIDRLAPEPSLQSPDDPASCAALAQLADTTLFFAAVPVVFQPAGAAALASQLGADGLARFQQDRAALFAGGSAPRPTPEYSRAHFPTLVSALDAQLAQRPFLLGDAPCLADFAVYNPVWFVGSNPGVRAALEPYPRLRAWAERIAAFGHGQPKTLEPQAALDIARDCRDSQPPLGQADTADGLQPGAAISVRATDYGVDPVVGRLVHIGAEEVALKRDDPRAGEVIVHFPRAGFHVAAA